MKTITPSESFSGYPDGRLRAFTKGVEAEVPDDYVGLLAEKGLIPPEPVRAVSPPSAPPDARTTSQEGPSA